MSTGVTGQNLLSQFLFCVHMRHPMWFRWMDLWELFL